MASILFKIVRISNSQFKCNYLKNGNLFLNFSFQFWNLNQILNIFKTRMIVIANVFPKLGTAKILLRPLSKKCRFSILFKIVRLCYSQFKCNYLKNENHFPDFFFRFLNLNQILNILKKTMIVIANVFPKLDTVKILVRPPS